MPTIEITPEQAAALARGESVSVAPMSRDLKTYVVVNTNSGHVFEFIVDTATDRAVAYRRVVRGGTQRVLGTTLTSPRWERIPTTSSCLSRETFSYYRSFGCRTVALVPNHPDNVSSQSPATVVRKLGV